MILNVKLIFQNLTIHGSEARMRTLTGYYANIFPKRWGLLDVTTQQALMLKNWWVMHLLLEFAKINNWLCHS